MAVLVVAIWTDVRSRRIPNVLTLTGMVVGVALRSVDGPSAALDGLLGAGLGLLVAIPFLALGALGGGDAKLLAAVGAFMGPARLVGALLAIAVIGGVIAIIEAGRRGRLRAVLASSVAMVGNWISLGRVGMTPTLETPNAVAIPYGVAIALGALIWWFWGGTFL